MRQKQTPANLERLFKAVANRRRVIILRYLDQKGQATVGNVAGHLKLSLSAISRHLDILEQAGFLEENQQGLLVFYRVRRQCLPSVMQVLQIILG